MIDLKSWAVFVCIFCVCVYDSEASRLEVVSLTKSVVRQVLPQNAMTFTEGHDVSVNRFKRNVLNKTLTDPNDCIYQCYSAEKKAVTSITFSHTMSLVGIALTKTNAKALSDPKTKDQETKKLEDTVVSNMGPMFSDFCSNCQKAIKCYNACPNSQLKQAILAEYEDDQVFCEPGKYWPTFKDYYAALKCNNESIKADKTCDTTCNGPSRNISAATSLKLRVKKGNSQLQYETDASKNTQAANINCKIKGCVEDCKKPSGVKKCGAKAWDFHVRMNKIDPTCSINTLKIVNAINNPAECKRFLK